MSFENNSKKISPTNSIIKKNNRGFSLLEIWSITTL